MWVQTTGPCGPLRMSGPLPGSLSPCPNGPGYCPTGSGSRAIAPTSTLLLVLLFLPSSPAMNHPLFLSTVAHDLLEHLPCSSRGLPGARLVLPARCIWLSFSWFWLFGFVCVVVGVLPQQLPPVSAIRVPKLVFAQSCPASGRWPGTTLHWRAPWVIHLAAPRDISWTENRLDLTNGGRGSA